MRVSAHLRFPDPNDRPAQRLEVSVDGLVPSPISLDLCDPVFRVPATSQIRPATLPVAAVPEITVDEDRDLPASDNDVWPSWELGCAEPVAHASSPQRPSQEKLGGRVPMAVGGSGRTGGRVPRCE